MKLAYSRATTIAALLFCSLWPAAPLAGERESITARHFAVTRHAAQDAIFHEAKAVANSPDGTPWLPDAPQCVTPVPSSTCDVPLDALRAAAPLFWEPLHTSAGTPRWQVHIQAGLCYVYGEADAPVMAAIRRELRHSAGLAFCPAKAANGAACLPPLRGEDGTPLPLPDGLSTSSGHVVSVFRIHP